MVQFASVGRYAPVLVWDARNYDQISSISEDKMPLTYGGWLVKFAVAKSFVPATMTIVEVFASPEEYEPWCIANDEPINASSRAKFAASQFRKTTRH